MTRKFVFFLTLQLVMSIAGFPTKAQTTKDKTVLNSSFIKLKAFQVLGYNSVSRNDS